MKEFVQNDQKRHLISEKTRFDWSKTTLDLGPGWVNKQIFNLGSGWVGTRHALVGSGRGMLGSGRVTKN